MAYTDTPKQTKSIELSNTTPNISAHVIKRISELGHPYKRKLLEDAGAIQAIAEEWPVLALPMESGDYHCVKYDHYHEDQHFRFLSCKLQEDGKKGRKKKTKLGLIGVDKATMESPVIWLTEGFWDYLTFKELGLPVWGCPGASNLISPELFKGKDVIICFDNDDQGDKWGTEHAQSLSMIAKRIKRLDLPSSWDGQPTKDISDLRREIGSIKRTKEILKKMVEDCEEFDFPTIDKIREVIIGKGSSIVKAEIITNMIVEDLAKQSGVPLPFNKGQELSLIVKGKDILTDANIDRYLSLHYNFLPSLDIWRSVKGLLYNHALREHPSVNIHTYSTYKDKELHFGSKGEGILSISEKDTNFNLQGDRGIFIKSPSVITMSKTDHDATVETIDDLLNVLNFDQDILSQEEQVHLIKVWFYNTFFNFDTMQPILCAIGESGSGKSQLFKFLKGILFGFESKRNYMLNIIPEDEHELTNMLKGKKYLFFDEVNENSPKIKKFLRTMATGFEMTYRPKYERHNVEFIPDAWMGINGLNLVSSREYDIAKRLCLVKLEPLSTQELTAKFGPEYVMYQKLSQDRPLIWKNIISEIQSLLGNLHKNKNDFIQLDTSCRFMGLANFAWQAWPDKKDITHNLFSKMEGLQSHHSADMDPMMDILEEWAEVESRRFKSSDSSGLTTILKTKTMFKELQPYAKDHGVKYFPKSERALGQWFSKREVAIRDSVGYERVKNTSTKNFEHRFKVPSGGKEAF